MVAEGWRANLPLRLGQVVATPAALGALLDANVNPITLLMLHASGDWGVLDQEDYDANVRGMLHGERIMSVYPITEDVKVWIITEWDRSVTTILLPEDY